MIKRSQTHALVLIAGLLIGGALPLMFVPHRRQGPFSALQLDAVDIDGRPLTLDTLRGHVVVFVFFSWTRRDGGAETLARLAERFSAERTDPNVLIIGISESETLEETRDAREDRHLSIPIIHDAGARLATHFRAPEGTMIYVYDRNRIPRGAVCGSPDLDGFEAEIRALARVPPSQPWTGPSPRHE